MRHLPAILGLILLATVELSAARAQAAPAATVQTGAVQPVVLRSRAIVDDDVVQLGDLFDGLGAHGATAVARAPEPGKRVKVKARWLAAVAQAYAVPWRPASRLDSVVIERSSHALGTRQIEGTLHDALIKRGISGNLSLILDNPGIELHLPKDAAPSLAISSLTHDPTTGRFSALIVAPADGTPLAKATVTGRAIEMAEIPVLRRRLQPGEVIREDDIEWISVRSDRLGRNMVTDAASLLGMSPRRPIRAGETVRSGELLEPILVEKNSLVTIRLETGRLVLTAQGQAMESGAMGDAVRVMNTKSNKMISATVNEVGGVRVKPSEIFTINQDRQEEAQ
jgi:flagella basal body P-ring formation protein FlgA